MRGPVWRAARALVPLGLCLAFPLLGSRPASAQPASAAFQDPYAPAAPPPDRYFANDSLLGSPLACTDEEKECLRYNRIYYPLLERCYPLGDGPGHCRFAVDRCVYERSGRVQGWCAPTDLCPPPAGVDEADYSDREEDYSDADEELYVVTDEDHYQDRMKMAYDGKCVKVGRLNKLCGPSPVNLAQHFFGDNECVSPQLLTPSTPIYIPQPEERGRCVFPNLRHDLTSVAPSEFFRECSERQSVCFAKQKVWLSTRHCHSLLERGPCADGWRVVLSREAWEAGRVEAACAPVNPCGNLSAQHRLMGFDRRCHDGPTVLRALCPGGVLLPNAFGEMACVTSHFYRHVIELRSGRPQTCELAHRVSYDIAPRGIRVQPECGVLGRVGCVGAF